MEYMGVKNRVIYPGTFDPLTLGHMDLIERTICLFDQVVIAVAKNTAKTPMFSHEQRIDLIRQLYQKNEKISVIGYDGLLVDCAKEHKCNVAVRGLRVVSDFDHEFQFANINRILDSSMETVFLTPEEKFTYISSTLVREIARMGGDISQFVPKVVEKALAAHSN